MHSICSKLPLMVAVVVGLSSLGGGIPGAESAVAAAPVSAQDDKKEGEHGEWWCAEHGVPEEICSQCDSKIAAACKKKGDWCKDHERAESQCFKCHPKLKEKFAIQYRAKYGKEPPPTNDDKEDGKKKDK